MYLGAACLGSASEIRHLPPWREAEAVAPRRRSPSRQPGLRGLGTVTQARSAWQRGARKGQRGEGSQPGCPGLGDLQQEQETRREPWPGGGSQEVLVAVPGGALQSGNRSKREG